MISWTIPANCIITASRESLFTASASVGGSNSSSSTSYYSASTSSGTSGRTEYLSSSSAAKGSGTSPVTTDGTSYRNTFSPTYNIATSTTQELVVNKSVSTSYVDEEQQFSKWTTEKTASDATIEFVVFTVPSTVYREEQILESATLHKSITLSETQLAAEKATVYEADRPEAVFGLNQWPEVLYCFEPPTTWNGYWPATESATSGTRFTVQPIFSTNAVSVVAASALTTSSVINSAVTQSLSWIATKSAQTTETVVTNPNQIPQGTLQKETSKHVTTSSTKQVTVFPAETVYFGKTNSDTSSATTSVVSIYSESLMTVQRRIGTIEFATTIGTPASTTRFITTFAAASSETSGTQSGRTFNFAGNQTAFAEPLCSTGFEYNNFERTVYAASGVAVYGETGGWITGNGGPIQIPIALTKRKITVAMPYTANGLTINGNSISYTNAETTSSMTFTITGQTNTVTQRPTGGRPPVSGLCGGGPIEEGCTIVEQITKGCYKDRIGATTTSFYGEATILTQGQTAPIRQWYPIRHVAPPSLRADRSPIVFAVPRNDLGLPPSRLANDI